MTRIAGIFFLGTVGLFPLMMGAVNAQESTAQSGQGGLVRSLAGTMESVDPVSDLDHLVREGDRSLRRNVDFSTLSPAEMGKMSKALQKGENIPYDLEDADLDDALEHMKERAEKEVGKDFFKTVSKRGVDDKPAVLIAHATALMMAGEPWAAAWLLALAHEANDEDATPLISLAAIANSHGMPSESLAFLEEAEDLLDDEEGIVCSKKPDRIYAKPHAVPMGMSECAALLANRGHAQLMGALYDKAEATLKQALTINPELSEAARGLVYALVKQDKKAEAQRYFPRAVWRLNNDPATDIPTKTTQQIAEEEKKDPALTQKPGSVLFLEKTDSGSLRFPTRFALDLSRQGQIGFPEPYFPKSGTEVPFHGKIQSDFIQALTQAQQAKSDAVQESWNKLMARTRRPEGLSDRYRQYVSMMESTSFPLASRDHELKVITPDIESNLEKDLSGIGGYYADVLRAEAVMAEKGRSLADTLGPQAPKPHEYPNNIPAYCQALAGYNDTILDKMKPDIRNYHEQTRVYFGRAFGRATAIASNVANEEWRGHMRLDIDHHKTVIYRKMQMEVGFALSPALVIDSFNCGKEFSGETPVMLDQPIDIPSCKAPAGWSGKADVAGIFSVEFNCESIKFVMENNILPTGKTSRFSKHVPFLGEVGAELGFHGEVELTFSGQVTIFAGPRGAIKAEGALGGISAGDISAKDGLYIVLDKDGMKDAGFRVVVEGALVAGGDTALGVNKGLVDTMDFSFVSSI